MSNESSKFKGKPIEGSASPAGAGSTDNEIDLWDLDDEADLEKVKSPEQSQRASIPAKRVRESSVYTKNPAELKIEPEEEVEKTEDPAENPENSDSEEKTKVALPTSGKKAPKEAPETKSTVESKLSELPDLEDLDELESTLDTPEVKKTAQEKEPIAESDPEPAKSTSKKSSEKSADRQSLSAVEKIGIFALLLILAASAIFSIIHFRNRVEIKPLISEGLTLPINGKMATVTFVETFWREPILTGDNADTVKRGAELIPVIKMNLDSNLSKNGAVRIFFRNDEGVFIGDNITRPIPSSGSLEISATDGFHDLGMHAAYRTGSSDPWMIQVLEGPSIGASMEEFKTLFETEVSADMR